MLQNLCSIFRYDFNGRSKVLFQASDSSTGKNGTIGKLKFQRREKLFTAASGEFDRQLIAGLEDRIVDVHLQLLQLRRR